MKKIKILEHLILKKRDIFIINLKVHLIIMIDMILYQNKSKNNIRNYQSPSIHSAKHGTIYNYNTITKNHGYFNQKVH